MNIDESKLHLELIKPNNYHRRTVPLAVVGHNRIGFNKEATSALELNSEYSFAEVSQGERGNELVLLFRFLKERTPNAFRFNSDHSGRIYISNKDLMVSVFGASASKTTRRLDKLEIDPDKKLILLSIQ